MSDTIKRPYNEMYPIARLLVDELRPYCERIEVAGSLRRKREMIGDIEIVALPKRKDKTQSDLFGNAVNIGTINLLHDSVVNSYDFNVLKGKNNDAKYIKMVATRNGITVNVDLFMPESVSHWGSVFMIRTGSHDFNMWVMTKRCKQVGITFKEGLVYRGLDLLGTREEEQVFDLLKMQYVPPEYRDGNKWKDYIR